MSPCGVAKLLERTPPPPAPWPRLHRWFFSPRLVLDDYGAKVLANPWPRRAAYMLASVGCFGVGFAVRGFL